MNYTRKELVQSEATMNQIRNAIYHLERFMKNNGIAEIRERFRRMGQNIAHTYIKFWKPIDYINKNNVKDVIATIYKNILNSSVSIDFDNNQRLIIVKDNDCPLCKYQYEDIQIAACEVIAAMVAEFVFLVNKEAIPRSLFSLEALDIKESRTLGSKSCIQIYKYNEERV